MVLALLWLLIDDVVEAIQEHACSLRLVPQEQEDVDGCIREQHERVERHELGLARRVLAEPGPPLWRIPPGWHDGRAYGETRGMNRTAATSVTLETRDYDVVVVGA